MADIIDNEEVDRDTVEPEELEQLFSKKYNLVSETAVSLKKSYINKLDGTKSLKLAVSLQDNSIEVYQLNNTSLTKVCRLSGHSKSVTEIVCNQKDESQVYSAGLDGVIKLWDTRTGGTCVQEYKDEEEELLRPYECMDVSCNGRVLCAGSQLVENDAYLVFWDQRNTKPLGGYWNSHTDDITQVKFHKTNTELIATGSLDGLLNVFNVMEQSEDDALLYSLNVENSVEKLSWLNDKEVACISQSNDLQVWDAERGDLVKSFTRDKISRSIKRSKGDDCYLVDAFTSTDDTCLVLAGSHAGHGDILRSVSVANKKLQPSTDFPENKQTVRCCWYDKDRDILVLSGESGLLSVYSGACPTARGSDAAGKLASAMRHMHGKRHRPY